MEGAGGRLSAAMRGTRERIKIVRDLASSGKAASWTHGRHQQRGHRTQRRLRQIQWECRPDARRKTDVNYTLNYSANGEVLLSGLLPSRLKKTAALPRRSAIQPLSLALI